MGYVFGPCRFIFCLLLIASQGIHSSARAIKVKNCKENVIDNGILMLNKHTDKPLSSQKDPTLNVYFKIEDLKVGNKFPIYFSLNNASNFPPLLSREESNSIPFSLSHLPKILDSFSFPQHSPQAIAMENTINECELEPLKGETKFCATSLESMLDLTHSAFGLDSEFKVLTTNFISKHRVDLQTYTVLEEVTEILTPKMLACHSMPYPYKVYYCHGQEKDRKLFKIKLEGENGDRVNALGVCHIDTSKWDPNHVAFQVLETRPGEGTVCHFLPADNLIWVVSTSTM